MKENIILSGHYEKFVQKAKRNPKMIRIPNIDELGKNGFDITDLFFLVLPNGLQVNPETVNPDIFEDEFKGLFLTKDPEQIPTSQENINANVKECEVCRTSKPIEEFRKRPGRGNIRRSICMQCEKNVKADITENISKDHVQIIDGKTGHIKRYIAYDDVTKLVREAYERGKKEANIAMVSPTLDELLGA